VTGDRGREPNEPIISVVIPARNEEAYLDGTLGSVAAQRYPLERIECVVVNNGSTDGTVAVAEAFAAAHPGLAFAVLHELQPGVSRAKNRGAQAARGELLLFLDADSRMQAGLLHDVAAGYRAGHPAGCIKIVADGGDPVERAFFALIRLGPLLFGIRSQMFYCRRDLFLAAGGFDETLRLGEDLELLSRLRATVEAGGLGSICYLRSSSILTSPRRLRGRPFHLAAVTMFGRWLLSFLGVGRHWEY